MTSAFAVSLVVLFNTFSSGASAGGRVAETAAAIQPLEVGQTIPSVKVRDVNGSEIGLREALAGQRSVVIFYRGGWCPYCNRHLKDLGKVQGELKKLGYKIYAVSQDKSKMLKSYKEKQKLSYQLLSDGPMAAAKAFGVAFRLPDKTVGEYLRYGIDLEKNSGFKHHILPVPSAFIFSKEGKLGYRYANADYKVRLDTEELLKHAKSLK